jgi:hypothetical protein
MFAANLVECFTHGAGSAMGNNVQALANSFLYINAGGDVEQALIGLRILHNGCRLAFNR